MHLRERRSGSPLLLSLLLLGGALASVAAWAEAPPPKGPAARQAEVEIVESRGKTSQTMRLVVSVTDNDTSQVMAQAGEVQYLLKLNRNTYARPGPVLSCDVERKERVGRSVQDVRIKSSAIVELGRRLTFARVVRPDGTRLEVSVTIR